VLSIFITVLAYGASSYINYDLLKSDLSVLFLYAGFFIMIFVVYFLFFRMYALAFEKQKTERETLLLQHQAQLQEEQYQKIQENMENSRRMRHDLKHHMLTLKGFLDNQDAPKAGEYLEQYLESTKIYEFLKLCDNPVVNMLACHYHALAQENGVDFTASIDIPKELSIQTLDISVVLGNILANAMEAACYAPKAYRNIRLHIICSGKMLAVTVDNGFDGTVKKNGPDYLSTKKGHSGLGLKSVTDIAKKYNGGVEFSHNDKEFHSSVMLGLESKMNREHFPAHNLVGG